MKLAIISHTEHYMTDHGTLVGWGPTVTEINHLLGIFDEIYHLAMLQKKPAPASALPYSSDKIRFVPIPTVGGPKLTNKIKIIVSIPETLKIVSEVLKKVDVFQFRAPTGIGVYLIPYLIIFSKKKGWFKYAGNWNQKNPPVGYRIQRWMLRQQSRKVTINGKWPNQSSQCLSFENPCLTFEEIARGNAIRKDKDYNLGISFCFVGRLEEEKGVMRIIEAFSGVSKELSSEIRFIHMVGDGPNRNLFERKAKNSGLPFIFYGSLPREKVFSIYEKSHFILLPTMASEGFPKVIAEAMNFSCIPLVSDISSITQYIINGNSGFVVSPLNKVSLLFQIEKLITLNKQELVRMNNRNSKFSYKFSYAHYIKRIKDEILSIN